MATKKSFGNNAAASFISGANIKEDNEINIEKKVASSEVPERKVFRKKGKNGLIQMAYYLTEEQILAIEAKAFYSRKDKSTIVREALDNYLDLKK